MGGRSRSRSRDGHDRKKRQNSADESREREANRRRAQQQFLKKYGKKAMGDTPMFWDGFEWMPKVANIHGSEAQLQAQSRRARRLYLGNLPLQAGITEQMLTDEINKAMKERNLCENVEGDPVIHVWFARDRGNYGFVEFRSKSESERALLLDGLQCCGGPVQIRRPSDFPMSPMPDILPAHGQPTPPAGGMPGMQPGMPGMMPAMPIALPVAIPQVSSKVVRLKAVFTPDEETDAADYDDVLEDMKGGCSAHGTVVSVFIVRPDHLSGLPDCQTADVFLEYSDTTGAGTCIAKMGGRKYDGKLVTAESFDEAMYNNTVKRFM